MYKILCFGLFLIGSLLMSALTFNVNLLSNVMAQEYDTYGDSYYSMYQNNDKKYECQKGPFKGFFVTSAEFCDAKSFDDKKMKKDRPIVEDPEPPEPQEPPTPTPQTSSLTINKEIFGCFSNSIFIMFCENLQDGDLRWLPCIGSSISTTDFCEQLTANLFDIEVLDDQNIPVVEPFIGSADGKIIENLEPGTYTVNEIKHSPSINELVEDSETKEDCINPGLFLDGGNLNLINRFLIIDYSICIEYEDEEGNDCSTITLAAGKSRTCTVKNHIQDTYRI